MKIVLATGIYPPAIGGPATYVRHLAEELSSMGHEVRVLTYGVSGFRFQVSGVNVLTIAKSGGPLIRWWRYAKVLKREAADADSVEAFSSVSAGVPLMLARLKKPKKILRLGGDFFWERYTDRGGELGLRQWYERKFHTVVYSFIRLFVYSILNTFDHILFSTRFEEELYERHYAKLPAHSVMENALPDGQIARHEKHDPFRLLFMGRFVGFKNLPALLEAVRDVPGVRIAFVGEGPMEPTLRSLARQWLQPDRYSFLPPATGEAKLRHFAEADLLVLPSITELSPNVALEARARGLPVLLTRETGLSERLTQGMILRDLSVPARIAEAIRDAMSRYDQLAPAASSPTQSRGWTDVAREHLALFRQL